MSAAGRAGEFRRDPLVGLVDLAPPAGAEEAAILLAEGNVLRRGQVGEQRQFLVDHAYAGGMGIGRALENHLAGLRHPDGAGGRLLDAAEDLDERALAGAVGAEQPADLTGVELDADAIEGADRRRIDLCEVVRAQRYLSGNPCRAQCMPPGRPPVLDLPAARQIAADGMHRLAPSRPESYGGGGKFVNTCPYGQMVIIRR